MRKLSNNYSVSYEFKNIKKTRTACYSELFRVGVNSIAPENVLTLHDIKCEETVEYLPRFNKLCERMFNIKIKYYEDLNKVEIKGFNNLLTVKIFVTLYRSLWETFDNYNVDVEKHTLFFKDLFENTKFKNSTFIILNSYSKNCLKYNAGHSLKKQSYGDDIKFEIFKNSKSMFKQIEIIINANSCKVHDVFNNI